MSRTLQLPTAEVFEPLLAPSRYKGAYGGRGGMKSHFFAETLLERCVMKPTRAVCVREVQRSLEQSVKRLLEDKIEKLGLSHEFRVMDTMIKTPNDGLIIFNGMQNHTADSIKSLEGYDIAWVEEAQSLSERSLTLLRPTIRTPGSELWFSWNPRHPTDPIDLLLRSADTPPNSIVVRSSYKDNPWFRETELYDEMIWDQRRDPEKYAHVWLGEYERHSESRVFKNWKVEEFDTPSDAAFLQGADWGFSIDPSTLVRSWLKPGTKTLMIDHEAYKIGCEVDDLPRLFDGLVCGCDYKSPRPCKNPDAHAIARRWVTIADSARPETISYLQRHGYPRMEAAKKGPNSIKEGVIFLQGYDIVIHPRCVHTIDEFTMYSYVVDKQTEQVTNVLEDKKNHIIDPVRYATERLRGPGVVKVKKAKWG